MSNDDPLLALAEQVASAAASLVIETAIIGGIAVSIHGGQRGTDDLDGVIDVWDREIEDEDGELVPDGLVQIINFKDGVGVRAVSNAQDADGLRVARLEDLILLKLNAGSKLDQSDVQLLLEANPVDIDELRALCRRFGLEARLLALLDRG